MDSWDIGVSERTLANGLPCVAIRMPHFHSLSVRLFVRAGSRYETIETNGISHLLEHMLFRGTERYPNSYELAAAVESMGASFNAETTRDVASFYVDLVPRHLGAGLDLLAEMFRAPRFVDLDVEREIVLEEMNEDYNDKGDLTDIDSLTKPRLWPGHPMGFPVIGTRRNLKRFSVDDLRAHWSTFYKVENMLLCATGRVDDDEFFAAAEKTFSFLGSGTATQQDAPTCAEAGSFTFVRDADSQVSLNLAWPGLSEQDARFTALGSLRRVLSDGISSRLHRRIVDDLGLAYSIDADVEAYHDAGIFEIEADLGADKLMPLLDELDKILNDIRATPPTAEELSKVRERQLCDLEVVQDEAGNLSEWIAGSRLFYTPRTAEQIEASIRGVTPEAVHQIACEILDDTKLHVTIVGTAPDSLINSVERRVGLPSS